MEIKSPSTLPTFPKFSGERLESEQVRFVCGVRDRPEFQFSPHGLDTKYSSGWIFILFRLFWLELGDCRV